MNALVMDSLTKVGRYEIVRELGQGGMGRVLLARDTVLGRQVAVKILRDDLGLPKELRDSLFVRMRHEARAVAALSHPNMVTLHDMGEEAGVGLFLVFEYIDGPTLRDEIDKGPLEALDVARMGRELGSALSHAHEAGVIHRDVKPENVLLAKTGAKLADFGIARLPDSTLTQRGSVLGTPAYSAPEALAQGEFSPASDQFSLAVTLYEALSGKRAFPGDDAITVATRVAHEESRPIITGKGLDARHLSRVNAMLARGMAKDPAARFPSCRELGEAVGEAIERRVFISDTPLPDLSGAPGRISLSIITKKTRRVQNVVAGAGVLVIVGLLLFGRSAPTDPGVSLRDVAEAFEASVATPHPTSVPRKPKAADPRLAVPSPARPSRDAESDGTEARHADAGSADATPAGDAATVGAPSAVTP